MSLNDSVRPNVYDLLLDVVFFPSVLLLSTDHYLQDSKKNEGTGRSQVVYAMVPIPPFSKLVLCMINIMTDGMSVDVISGNFS